MAKEKDKAPAVQPPAAATPTTQPPAGPPAAADDDTAPAAAVVGGGSPDPDDAELRAYLSRRFADPAALASFVGLTPAVTAPVHTPGAGLDPVAGDAPRKPRRASDAPFDLHVLAEDAAGNDVTVREVVAIIREIVADLKAGDVFEAIGDVGTLLGYAQMIFGAGQTRTFVTTPAGRREAFGAFGEFDKACEEFDKVRGAVPNKVASADVSVSGAARGLGDGGFGVQVTPGEFAAIIGVVQTVIDLIRKLRAKRGV